MVKRAPKTSQKIAKTRTATEAGKNFGRKRQQIVQAARDLFLAHGYTVTSMDAVADRASVSKATLYSYYNGKRELFAEIVRDLLNRYSPAIIHEDAIETDVRVTLLRIGRSIIDLMLADDDVAAHRMVVAEAARSPELGKLYYEIAPLRLLSHLEHILKNAVMNEQLRIEDTARAAEQFVGLVRGNLHLEALLCVRKSITAQAREIVIKSGVDVFYRAYGPAIDAAARRR